MVRRSVTRQQVSGYRFLTRRMEYALACRDVRMLDDPIRSQTVALAAGVVLAAIGLAICAVLALLRPHGSLGAEPVVMVRESGAVYVRIGDTMHPAPNLASARLIAGTPARPRLVSAEMIAEARRGPMVGIPGAPGIIGPPLEQPAWSVCDDDAGRTTMIIGPPVDLPAAPAMLVSAAHERAPGVYLIHAGRRAAVDVRDRAAVRALRLDGVVPRTVSAALLDALPDAAPIVTPRIPGAGGPGPGALREFRVGEVVRVPRAGATDHYVVLADGVQRVGRVAADLIHFADADGAASIPDVPAHRLAEVAVRNTLALTDLSDVAVTGAGPGGLCVSWRWHRDGQAPDTAISTPAAPAELRRALALAQADGAGPRIDAVAVPAGRSAYLRAGGVAGDGMASGPRYLVTDAGVAYGIGAARDAESLGLPPTPAAAPWPLLALLPRGPELSAGRAAVLRDSIGSPS